MKTYFRIIKYLQQILLVTSILILIVLPIAVVFMNDYISYNNTQLIYSISHITLLFVMLIRPLADIFTKTKFIRPLVILRKGAGVLSASIIVSFILAKLMMDPTEYFRSIFSLIYWSMWDYAVLAHMADLSAIILLVTSNNLSKRVLGGMWKNIQKLSYLYFYGSAFYVYLSYNDTYQLLAIVLVTTLTSVAFIKNKKRLSQTTYDKN